WSRPALRRLSDHFTPPATIPRGSCSPISFHTKPTDPIPSEALSLSLCQFPLPTPFAPLVVPPLNVLATLAIPQLESTSHTAGRIFRQFGQGHTPALPNATTIAESRPSAC